VISIVVCTYNSSDTISGCLSSIFQQTYTNFEVVIQDGGSTDETLDLIDHWKEDERLKLVSERDAGIYDAFNKGWKRATQPYVYYLHSDDEFYHNTVLDQFVHAITKLDNDVLFGDTLLYYSESRLYRYWSGKNFNSKLSKFGLLPSHTSCFIKKKVFEDLGGFWTNYEIASDFHFLLRVFLSNYSHTYVPTCVNRMRLGGISTQGINAEKIKYTEDKKILSELGLPVFFGLLLKKASKLFQWRVSMKRIENKND